MGTGADSFDSDYRDTPVLQVFNPSGFNLPVKEESLQTILVHIETEEETSFTLLEVVFVDEIEIVRINKQYLDRDYITDVISFRYDEKEDSQSIEGTLYCCAPRIAEQAREFGVDPQEEFCRIFIHGLLHLIGYDDQTDRDKEHMSRLEDHYLKP